MITFLFEQYGYYPKDLSKDNSFEIDNWLFRLIEIEYEDSFIESVDRYITELRDYFEAKGSFIIKTRFNKKVSIYDGKRYVLVSVNKCNMSLQDLNKLHCAFIEKDKYVDLNNLFATWEERISIIDAEAVSSLRIDSVYYKNNIEITMFCLGLAQNALQYLSEVILDYDKKVENVTITHKRLKNLNSFDFWNPFNLIIDHPLRDLVELYKNDFIQFDELLYLFEYYNMEIKTASLFMARLLYPGEIFDRLDDNIKEKSTSFKLVYNIEREMQKIKKVYLYLKDKYGIRPIIWLEN